MKLYRRLRYDYSEFQQNVEKLNRDTSVLQI
jgi:hypothetical protein